MYAANAWFMVPAVFATLAETARGLVSMQELDADETTRAVVYCGSQMKAKSTTLDNQTTKVSGTREHARGSMGNKRLRLFPGAFPVPFHPRRCSSWGCDWCACWGKAAGDLRSRSPCPLHDAMLGTTVSSYILRCQLDFAVADSRPGRHF